MYEPYGLNIAKSVKDYHINNGGVSRFKKFKYWHKKYFNKTLNDIELFELSDKFSKIVLNDVINSDEIPGALSFIKKYSKNHSFFIITGTPQKEIEIILDKIKLKHHFIEVLGSPKNKIEWCSYLKQKYSLIENETIFLGDALTDYEAANKNNFHFALRTASYNYDLFEKINNKIDFKDFNFLEKILCKKK